MLGEVNQARTPFSYNTGSVTACFNCVSAHDFEGSSMTTTNVVTLRQHTPVPRVNLPDHQNIDKPVKGTSPTHGLPSAATCPRQKRPFSETITL